MEDINERGSEKKKKKKKEIVLGGGVVFVSSLDSILMFHKNELPRREHFQIYAWLCNHREKPHREGKKKRNRRKKKKQNAPGQSTNERCLKRPIFSPQCLQGGVSVMDDLKDP